MKKIEGGVPTKKRAYATFQAKNGKKGKLSDIASNVDRLWIVPDIPTK
jgi:hypothetical protein